MTAIATEHVRELAARKSKAFELFLALEENPHADESCFRSLAQIVDWIVLHPIALDGGTLDDLLELVRSEQRDLASTLPVLGLALSEAANPGRMRVLVEGYAKWLRDVSDTARPYLLGILPNIAAGLDEMQGGGVDTLIACLNACARAEDCEILAGCVGRYQETCESVIVAAAEIAGVAAIAESRPARELLPALAKLRTAAAGKSGASDAVWSAAVGVCVAVAGISHSSALHLSRDLEGSLAVLPASSRLAYLSSLQRLVEQTGTSLLRYGARQLPALFQEAGDERASQFVEQGIAIARRYGRVAATEFFEQRSGASREASPHA